MSCGEIMNQGMIIKRYTHQGDSSEIFTFSAESIRESEVLVLRLTTELSSASISPIELLVLDKELVSSPTCKSADIPEEGITELIILSTSQPGNTLIKHTTPKYLV